MTWKFLFIGLTTLLLYFAYGVASHGGPWAFFAGVAVGSVITYLFMRYKAEAAANTNINTQNVNVNLHQQKMKASGLNTLELAELVDSILEKKLLQLAEPPQQPAIQYQPNQRVDGNTYRNRLIGDTLKQLRRGIPHPIDEDPPQF